MARRRRAESERNVTLRPAPEVMSQLSALLSVRDGVAVYATLCRLADAAVAAGDLARELAVEAIGLRRLYATPAHGDLVAMDSKATHFPAGLARFIRFRDRSCLTKWCDAPARHSDHVEGLVDDGPTSGPNGQCLCEACNYAKSAPGWSARPRPGPRHSVTTVTPTGHAYRSRAPAANEFALVPFRFVLTS